MPLVRRVPKRGFNNAFASVVVAVNVGQLEEAFDDGAEVTVAALRAKSLIPNRFDEVKILGDGELTKKLKVTANRFSESARQKIEKAGGEAVAVAAKIPVAVKQQQARERKRQG